MKQIALKLGFTALLGLSACAAQTRWEKPDATVEATGADFTECRKSALQEASRQTARSPAPPAYPFGYYGVPYDDFLWRANYDSWSANQRFYLQNRLTDYCMHNKGYERVPIKPS